MYFFYFYPLGLDRRRTRLPVLSGFLLASMVVAFLWVRYFPDQGPCWPYELVFQPGLTWPTFDSATDIDDLCDSALFYRVQLLEAKKLGLEEQPEVRRKIIEKRRWMGFHAYRRARIFPEINPTEEELRAVYAERRSSYDLPERRRFHLVNTPTRELAGQAADMMRDGKLPTEIFEALRGPGIEFEITPDTTIGWVSLGDTPRVDGILFSLGEGEISDPFPDQGRYSVLRVDGIALPKTVTFEEAESDLRRELIMEREAKVLERLVEDARPLFEVVVDRDLIARMEIDTSRARGRSAVGRP